MFVSRALSPPLSRLSGLHSTQTAMHTFLKACLAHTRSQSTYEESAASPTTGSHQHTNQPNETKKQPAHLRGATQTQTHTQSTHTAASSLPLERERKRDEKKIGIGVILVVERVIVAPFFRASAAPFPAPFFTRPSPSPPPSRRQVRMEAPGRCAAQCPIYSSNRCAPRRPHTSSGAQSIAAQTPLPPA